MAMFRNEKRKLVDKLLAARAAHWAAQQTAVEARLAFEKVETEVRDALLASREFDSFKIIVGKTVIVVAPNQMQAKFGERFHYHEVDALDADQT